MHLKQGDYDIRCEWGIHGLQALRDDSDVLIIVDVLSFTTAVDVAVSRGAQVYPFVGHGEDARQFAHEHHAILAHKRPQSPHDFSLSPASLQQLPQQSRVVLPSPNGSTLSTATGDVVTLAGCLRNARVVAEYAQMRGQRISVIPAGERFIYSDTDTALRPSLEDWLGAGALIAYLAGRRSPEAQTAQRIYETYQHDLQTTLETCVSGVELIDKGYAGDVIIASQVNVSSCVPMLVDGAYHNMTYHS